MEEFEGIDLFDCFIESWKVNENEFEFKFDASIWPKSEYYEKPKVNEYTCYKKSTLTFSKFSEITGLKSMSEVTPSIDATGKKDYGNFEYFAKLSHGFEIQGEFGKVLITGGNFVFTVNA